MQPPPCAHLIRRCVVVVCVCVCVCPGVVGEQIYTQKMRALTEFLKVKKVRAFRPVPDSLPTRF